MSTVRRKVGSVEVVEVEWEAESLQDVSYGAGDETGRL